MEACNLANLYCEFMLEEPVSAAFYIATSLGMFEKKILEKWFIYDLGGGTLDVALVEVGNN